MPISAHAHWHSTQNMLYACAEGFALSAFYLGQWSVQEPLSPRLATANSPVGHWPPLLSVSFPEYFSFIAPNLVCVINNNNNNNNNNRTVFPTSLLYAEASQLRTDIVKVKKHFTFSYKKKRVILTQLDDVRTRKIPTVWTAR